MRTVTQEVSLVTKHGVETKNYETLGDAAQLKPIERELKRLEDLSNEIVQDFALMRKREEEMRDTNGKNNTKKLNLLNFVFQNPRIAVFFTFPSFQCVAF